MSDELKGAIITAIVTGIISIIGFVVIYNSMKKNFKNELEKEKTSVHIEKMSIIPYFILELLGKITKSQGQGDILNDFNCLMNTVYAYGSEKAIFIAATMQKENYEKAGTDQFEKYRAISLYTLLATQIKYDVTGIVVSPEFWLQMKLNDYSVSKSEFKKANNLIVKELNLKSEFKVK